MHRPNVKKEYKEYFLGVKVVSTSWNLQGLSNASTVIALPALFLSNKITI